MTDTSNYIIATGIDITERKHLEKALLDISAREQRRIGQDLHDGLGQHLTGIAFMAKVHEAKLAEKQSPKPRMPPRLCRLVNEAIHKTRELARGLLPVVSDAWTDVSAFSFGRRKLKTSLESPAAFRCENPVSIHDDAMATHLYHIAQEAVNNAIKHGKPRKITDRVDGGEWTGHAADQRRWQGHSGRCP